MVAALLVRPPPELYPPACLLLPLMNCISSCLRFLCRLHQETIMHKDVGYQAIRIVQTDISIYPVSIAVHLHAHNSCVLMSDLTT